jgi:hypothetical protein
VARRASRKLVDLCRRALQNVKLLEWSGDARDMAGGSIAVGFDLAPWAPNSPVVLGRPR